MPLSAKQRDVLGLHTGDGREALEVRTGAGDIAWTAIPDSVVSRPNDINSNTQSAKLGLKIESTVEWPSIGAELSNNSSGFSTAYIYRESDGQLMRQTDISTLTAGDTFTVEDVDLAANTVYNFVIDNGGSDWTVGFLSDASTSFPYTSSDGQLSINDGAEGATGQNNAAIGLTQVGDVGF